MEPKQLAGALGIPFVVALTELVKRTFPKLQSRFYPSIAVFWGIVLNVVVAYLLQTDLTWAGVVGALVGLWAAGIYQYGVGREGRDASRIVDRK